MREHLDAERALSGLIERRVNRSMQRMGERKKNSLAVFETKSEPAKRYNRRYETVNIESDDKGE